MSPATKSPEPLPGAHDPGPSAGKRPLAAFLVRSLPRGGLETVLLAQCQGAHAAGLDPRVLCLEEPGPLASAFQDAGIPVEALGLPGAPLGASLQALPRLRRWLRAHRPRLLQVHMRRAGTLGRLAARLEGVPTLVALHNQDPPPPAWLAPLERRLDAGSAFLAVSRSVAGHAARQRGIAPERIPVLPNPLPAPGPPIRRRRLGSPRVGFLGKLEAKKDPAGFLRAAAALRVRRPGLEVEVAGDGPLRAPLEAEAAALGLPAVFHGVVEDGPGFLAGLDLACFPSLREGFGLAVGEALAAGVPVLLADIPPFREVYGRLPEACFLPPGAGPTRAAARMAELLEDPGLARRIREVAPRILAAHAPARAQARYREFYRGWLAG